MPKNLALKEINWGCIEKGTQHWTSYSLLKKNIKCKLKGNTKLLKIKIEKCRSQRWEYSNRQYASYGFLLSKNTKMKFRKEIQRCSRYIFLIDNCLENKILHNFHLMNHTGIIQSFPCTYRYVHFNSKI